MMDREVIQDLKQLLLLTIIQRDFRRALICTVLDATSCYAARSSQETRQGVPPWISLPVPLFKEKDEKDSDILHAMLQGESSRAAGAESKNFCLSVSVAFFKPRSQTLKLLIFVKR